MDKNTICAAVKSVIKEIQEASGYECPELKGNTKPVRDVEQFSSEIWPAAAAIISAQIGAEIPPEENIFFDDVSKDELTIDQCAEKVLRIIAARATLAHKVNEDEA